MEGTAVPCVLASSGIKGLPCIFFLFFFLFFSFDDGTQGSVSKPYLWLWVH